MFRWIVNLFAYFFRFSRRPTLITDAPQQGLIEQIAPHELVHGVAHETVVEAIPEEVVHDAVPDAKHERVNKPAPEAPKPPQVHEEPIPARVPEPTARPKVKAPENRGVTRLKADVLDELEHYLIYIKRLKKSDPEAYGQYRRLGAFLCHPDILLPTTELEPDFIRTLPSFGAVTLPLATEKKEGMISVRFAYFTKLSRPGSYVERANSGVTYRCTGYYDEKDSDYLNKLGHGVSHDVMVNILPDGSVRTLRVMKSSAQVIRHRKGNIRSTTITHQRWGLPDAFGDTITKTFNGNVAKSIEYTFIVLMNSWVHHSRMSMIRVTATKNNIVMPFVVDVLDTPRFFGDRECIEENGRRKPIFHVVRAHVRNIRGVTKGIKMHFSGLRRFQWNGYQIAISVPGKDHLDHTEFDIGCMEDVPDEEIKDNKFMNLEQMAEALADYIGAPGKDVAA